MMQLGRLDVVVVVVEVTVVTVDEFAAPEFEAELFWELEPIPKVPLPLKSPAPENDPLLPKPLKNCWFDDPPFENDDPADPWNC